MGNNILIPYSGHIPGGIHVGTDVVISGRVLHNCSRMSMNLCVGPTYEQDCALHFNPRFDENKVVRNHMQGGSWGTEETTGGNPFRRGHAFEIHMKVNHNGYEVIVNQRHFCNFNHRLPKESVQYIYIEGDVAINYIQFRGSPTPSAPGGYTPPSYPPTPGYPGGGSGGTLYSPSVPLTTPILGGLQMGRIIHISGIPNPNATRFTVNLQCGFSGSDIALHFDVRFNYGSDRNQVIRTHCQGGNYGNEEKHITHFPFYPNGQFEMMILTEPSCFKIAVNNQHFVEFFHRLQPFNRADHLNITGDVRLTQVRFQ